MTPAPAPHLHRAGACGPGAIHAVDRRLIERRRLQCGRREPAASARVASATAATMAAVRVPERLVASARSAQTSPIAGDEIYCTTAAKFTADLHTPPVVSLLTTTLPTSARAGVQVSLSKISTVRINVRRGRNDRVEQRRDGRTRQAEAAVADAVAGGHLLGHGHRDRPGRQLRHRDAGRSRSPRAPRRTDRWHRA